MAVPSISITDLTSSDKIKEGTGIFDVLFRKVTNEVEGQFTKGYLKGSEYAEVYLGAIQATLQQSMQFLLSRDELNIKLQILDLERQAQAVAIEKLKVEKEILDVNLEILELQKTELNAKIDLMELEKITVGKQQILLDKQIATEDQRKLNMAQELLLTTAQKDLVVQQKLNAITENSKLTEEIGLVTANVALTNSQKTLTDKNATKTDTEITLLAAKVTTENSQPAFIAKQIELYEAQRVGFGEDALIKRKKINADMWAVARTTDPDTPLPAGVLP